VIEYAVGFATLHSITIGTLLPRANAAACPQLAKDGVIGLPACG
jgi:hypothetical protein